MAMMIDLKERVPRRAEDLQATGSKSRRPSLLLYIHGCRYTVPGYHIPAYPRGLRPACCGLLGCSVEARGETVGGIFS